MVHHHWFDGFSYAAAVGLDLLQGFDETSWKKMETAAPIGVYHIAPGSYSLFTIHQGESLKPAGQYPSTRAVWIYCNSSADRADSTNKNNPDRVAQPADSSIFKIIYFMGVLSTHRAQNPQLRTNSDYPASTHSFLKNTSQQ